MSNGKKKNNSGGSGSGPASPPFIMDGLKLLLAQMAAPEGSLAFTSPSRASQGTIQQSINPPPLTWTWPSSAARQAQNVSTDDLNKYGVQTDVNLLFQLTAVSPPVWQAVHTGPTITWTWPNTKARTGQAVSNSDVGKVGIQEDVQVAYVLTNATPQAWQPLANGTVTSSPFELSTGAADADSYHDFFRLQIAFDDVWSELLDRSIAFKGAELYGQYNALMDQLRDNTGADDRTKTFPDPPDEIGGADQLQAFVDFVKATFGLLDTATSVPAPVLRLAKDLSNTVTAASMLLQQLNRVGKKANEWDDDQWLDDADGNADTVSAEPFKTVKRRDYFSVIYNDLQALIGSLSTVPATGAFTQINSLLKSLDSTLKEKYSFDVFAPASINFGVLLNYRQHWRPQSYQVGNLVSTIPLAPQETRRYTTKTVVKRTRNVKEIDESLRSGKDESSLTWRVDSEIVDRARNQTNFQKTASGSFGNDNMYKVSAGMQQGQDQAVESAQTKRDFHESVIRASQEYRNNHRLEISTEESREDEQTSFREIRNPNDELTVTYLFYELQRRYLVDESLHKVTPVILVANEVPAPHEVDQDWLLRHDWVIRRAILDDSFLPALEYLSSNYVGDEVALEVLGLNVQQQRSVVDRISQQVQLANEVLGASTLGLEKAENERVSNLKAAEAISIVKSVFDPLGITGKGPDGNAERARLDFAKSALDRAQSKVNQLVGQLKTDMTALQVAVDKYTATATHHFDMLAEIDRLRIHVKDNIIYYMQAIWTYEPPDQRYFRLYNLDVPDFSHNTSVNVTRPNDLSNFDRSVITIGVRFPLPTLEKLPIKLHQVADIENLIGFKGNYMIFPMVRFNYLTWFMMQEYLHFDETSGVTARDPDPLADLTIEQLKEAMSKMHKADPKSFDANEGMFGEIMRRLLSKQGPEMVIVPSKSLYIEALPGTHPLLEDFKLIHRAVDVRKAQADVRRAELENLRFAARLANNEHGDPDIDKVVVVESGKNVRVDAG